LSVIVQAQDIVAAAEHADLAHALAGDRQQLMDAQRRLTQARADGDGVASLLRLPPSRTPSGRRRS
jgi:hypothetical protein